MDGWCEGGRKRERQRGQEGEGARGREGFRREWEESHFTGFSHRSEHIDTRQSLRHLDLGDGLGLGLAYLSLLSAQRDAHSQRQARRRQDQVRCQRLLRGKPPGARRAISSAIQNEDRQRDACIERGLLTIRQRCLKSREAAEEGSRRHPRRDGAIRTMGIEI